MHELLAILMAWVGASTGYNVDLATPNVVVTDRYNMCAVYGIETTGQCDAAKLMGFYDKRATIYLHDGFNVQDKADVSRLLHELTHYVQWANHVHTHTCLGMLEVEAYELQDRWRREVGLAAAFDPFRKVMFEASCDP